MIKRVQDFTLKQLVHHCEQHNICEGCIIRKLNAHICDIIGHIYLMTDEQFEKKINLNAEEES